ncbi:MAG TPA: S9 family peptidase [Candidatus Eisenbacteria bacterium]|nr:S9 family peptidase [Candidatus Eisenbacteria bacterium]
MRHPVTLAMLVLALAAPARAAAPDYTLEHALTLRSFGSLTWSADGRRLAFTVTENDTAETTSNQDLWLWQAGADTARRLTRSPKNDWSPTFSPGGDTVAFCSARIASDDVKPGIFMLSLEGGEPWAFGSYDEGVGEVAWSPDGRWLAYVKPDTLPRRVRDWRRKKWDQVVEDERLQYPHLWVVEVRTGRHRRLTSGTQWIWNARWSPDSRSIAFLTSPSGKPDDENAVDVGVVAVSGGPARRLGVIGNGSFAWSPDGRWIALATGADRDAFVEKNDLWLVPAAGGGARNLTAGFDEDAYAPAWSAGSDTLFFHSAQGVTSVVAAVPLAGGPPVLSTVRTRSAAGTPAAAGSGRAAWIQSSTVTPAEVWIADHVRLEGRAVTRLNAAVARLKLGTTRSVRWTSSDGVTVEGLLLRPPGTAETGALKTLVLLHGGPYTTHYALGFEPVPQHFAAHGYQVFMPNFRSSGGYGTAFMVRRRADWGGQDWRDVVTGIDSLVRWGLADPRRLGVYGHSYGGYLSAWAITQTDRFDAAMVSAGAVDLGAHWGQSDIQQYRAFDFSGTPWGSPETWQRASPITHVGRVKTPTLVFAGEEDRRVPYPQGQQLYRALLALRVPTEFVHYPREPHTYREYRHNWDRWTRTLAWFDRWVK